MHSTIRLALDWTPNTNHTGFYVALAKEFYLEAGIILDIISPDVDDYKTTPARRVASRQVEFGIAPTESIISYRTTELSVPLVAVAAILARDASAIVTLEDSGIDRPRKLDGQRYASYDARFEDHIVRQMIRNDGGMGNIEIINPPMLGIWNTLLEGKAESTWVFLPWEGVEARRRGIALNAFRMEDYGIPYGYSPVLLAHEIFLHENRQLAENFLAATRRGFEWAEAHPEDAAELLIETARHPSLQDQDFVVESQRYITPYYREKEKPWGSMRPKKWSAFLQWLKQDNILTDRNGNPINKLIPSALYTEMFYTV